MVQFYIINLGNVNDVRYLVLFFTRRITRLSGITTSREIEFACFLGMVSESLIGFFLRFQWLYYGFFGFLFLSLVAGPNSRP